MSSTEKITAIHPLPKRKGTSCRIRLNPLLASIEKKEVRTENGSEITEYVKEAIFNERTVSAAEIPEMFAGVTEALEACINISDKVDLDFISSHTGKTKEEAAEELLSTGQIFLNPAKVYAGHDYYNSFELREVYLSGNVRSKLDTAEKYFATNENKFGSVNIDALKAVMPEWIGCDDIKIALGSNMIRLEDYEKFAKKLLELSFWEGRNFHIEYESMASEYRLSGRNYKGVANNVKFGTDRINAATILERLMNNRNVEVKDAYIDEDGKKKYVLNQPATELANEKARMIMNEWEEWLFDDEERVEYYEEKYNRLFNSEVLPEYSGENLTIPFMNNEVALREHQKSAITRGIRGNLLLAHPVGAGKTYVLAGTAMKLKSIGAARKPMIVVPNSLVGQFAADFNKMFPAANVLAVTEKDFQKQNRKRFIAKIAMGNYDAVIMGHSQFTLIGMSPERTIEHMQDSLDMLIGLLNETHKDKKLTIKQLSKQIDNYEKKIKELMNVERKDDEIYFEDLGVDALMIDEAHEFKNLEITTKMSRTAGIQTASSQKAYDLYMKCKYINETQGERNIVLSTGTPLSNTVCEMYTWQRYLAENNLAEKEIHNFDDWINLFGLTEDVLEVSPEGDKFQSRKKINKFRNIPELKKMFFAFADVKQKDELNLPVPELAGGDYDVVECEPGSMQRAGQKVIVKRANDLHHESIDPRDDNMLKLCSDAKKLAIDPRLCMSEEDILSILDDSLIGSTKLNACIDNVYRIYKETEDFKGTQVIFSDIGTPKSGKKFSVYDYIKQELVNKGIPAEEICFIHDANNNKEKIAQMHEDMRTGRKRVIIGSTSKLGTGTNIQTLLVAEHDIDVPWRPSDMEQREGRIIRQGNTNKEVHIYKYLTKGSFDAYNYNTVLNKARFISQIMDSKDLTEREHEDISETVARYAELVAIATGNKAYVDLLDVENELRKLTVSKKSFVSQQRSFKNLAEKKYPQDAAVLKDRIKSMEADLEAVSREHDDFVMTIKGKTYDNKTEAAEAIAACMKENKYEKQKIGEYRGFTVSCKSSLSELFKQQKHIYLTGAGQLDYLLDVSDAAGIGVCTRIDNRINKICCGQAFL